MPGPFDAVVATMTRQQAQILAHYSAGESGAEIRTATGLPAAEITAACESLAQRNRGLARDLAVAWQQQNPDKVNGHKPAPPPAPAPVAVAAPSNTIAPTIAALLTRAVATGVPRMVRAADKIQGLVDQLGNDLAEHEAQAALRAKAEKLEEELAEVRRQLGSKKNAAPAAAVDHKAIRKWALGQGIECGQIGQVSKKVIELYQEAMGNA